MIKSLVKSNCLLGSLLLIECVKMSGVVNSALTIHILEPNRVDLADVFDYFASMQLVELVCVILMKYKCYATIRVRQDLSLLILRGQLTKAMLLCLM